MTHSSLRRATLEDLDALVALEEQFPGDRITRRAFRHLLTHARAEVWVYEETGRALGNIVMLYRARSRRARVYSVVTHPDVRGRGIGSRLLRTAERAATARGCRLMTLEVRADNLEALRLYRRCGYAASVRLDGFYEDRAPALRMEKPLARSSGRPVSQPAAAALRA